MRLKFPAKGAKVSQRTLSQKASRFAALAYPLRPLREIIALKGAREVSYIIQKSMFSSRSHVTLGDLSSMEVQRTPNLCRCESYTVIQVQRTVTKDITIFRYCGAMHLATPDSRGSTNIVGAMHLRSRYTGQVLRHRL